CTEHSRKALQRIVNTAGKIIGAPLPSLKDIYTTRLTRKATSIVNDNSHPAHSLFSLLPSGSRYRSLCCRTTRLRNSFIHQAVRKLNSLPSLPPAKSVSLTGSCNAPPHTSTLYTAHIHHTRTPLYSH